jgi:hypothetical protein
MNELHGPDANERHERNKRAMAYLDMAEKRDAELEQEWKERWQARGLGCVLVLLINAVVWYAVYCIAKALGEL